MGYRSIAGAEADSRTVAALSHLLGAGESPVAGASSSRFQYRLHDLKNVTLLITTSRLLVSRGRLIGQPRADVEVDLTRLATSGHGPLMGVGPTWEVHFHDLDSQPALMYFRGPQQAEDFQRALAAAARGACGPPADGPPDFDPLHDLVEALRDFATPPRIGEPFAEGAGLEQAIQALRTRIPGPDACRDYGRAMCLELITGARHDGVADDVLRVMGADAAGTTSAGGIGNAALALVSEMPEGPGSMYELWSRRDDVADEMLCWLIVARLRMATAGLMDPLARP